MSDNPLFNRPQDTDMDIMTNNEKPLSLLWEEFEINLGRFLLNLWRKFCNGLRLAEPDGSETYSLKDVFDQEIERRRQTVLPGYTAQEVADGLRMLANAKSKVFDINEREERLDQSFAAAYDLTVEDARYRRAHNLSMLPQALSFTQVNSDGFELVLPGEEQ